MKYRKLGRTGLDVSLICLGTMTWGMQNTETDGHAQIDYALDRGVNFMDTAEMYAVPPSADTYGKTETIIGTWFAKTHRREEIILASKVVGAGIGWIREGRAVIDRKNILEAVEGSLKRLQTDYIDLYQLHWPNRGSYHFQRYWEYQPRFNPKAEEENFIAVLETLQDLIKAGKIRHAGLSNETGWGMTKWLDLSEKRGLPRMASIQNEYSLLSRTTFEPDLHEIAMAENCGLLAWSPLATGMLSGKYLGGARPKGSRWQIANADYPALKRDTPRAQEAVRAYMKVADKHGLDMCRMALAFVNSRPFVTSTIIGATTMEQLKNNIASIDLTLSQEILDDIQAVYRDFPQPY